MKWVLVFLGLVMFFFAGSVSAQVAAPQCPTGFVCLTPTQARAGLEAMDKVTALENQVLDLKKAILDEKNVTIDVKIELAKTTGQLTGAQSELISLRAMNELLLKMVRPKKIGLINLF
jgi:hypothetical protein